MSFPKGLLGELDGLNMTDIMLQPKNAFQGFNLVGKIHVGFEFDVDFEWLHG
jgi:hypothetical protein